MTSDALKLRKRVYVAGPYSAPDPVENTYRAIYIGDLLWRMGYVPFVPHLSHFWHRIRPHTWAEWLEYDLQWVLACHAVLWMSGDSPGADREAVFARAAMIPVYLTVAQLLQGLPPSDPEAAGRILAAWKGMDGR